MKPYESPFYEWLDRPAIRDLVDRAVQLEPGERLILIKGVPALLDSIGLGQLEEFLDEIRVKARRYVEAETHPGTGHASRTIPGEKIGGPTPDGHLHLDAQRDPYREGGRDAERALEAELWERRESDAPDDNDCLH